MIEEIQAAESVQPLIDRLLSRVFLAEDWEGALEQWLASPFTNSFVTVEGDCLFADGRVLARSPVAGQSLLHKRHEIRALDQRCSELKALCLEEEARVKAAQGEGDELEQELSAAEQETKVVEEASRRAEQAGLEWQADRQKWLAKLELLSAEDLREEEDRRFHQETLTVHDDLLQQYGLAESRLRAELDELDNHLRGLQAGVEAAEKDFMEKKIAQSQDQQRERQLATELDRIAKDLDEAVGLLVCEAMRKKGSSSLAERLFSKSARRSAPSAARSGCAVGSTSRTA